MSEARLLAQGALLSPPNGSGAASDRETMAKAIYAAARREWQRFRVPEPRGRRAGRHRE
jgi:hypothetical protein